MPNDARNLLDFLLIDIEAAQKTENENFKRYMSLNPTDSDREKINQGYNAAILNVYQIIKETSKRSH